MQSVHSVIAKAEVAAPDVVEVVDVAEDAPAASASTPMALTTATPPTSGPLGPTVIPTVIPTLKQLQDIKRKTVVVPNNNNNYVALTSPLKPPPGAKPLPDATGSPAAEPEKTNQDQDGGEPPAKRMREDTEPGDGSPGVAVSRPPTPPRPSHTSIMSISSILSAPTTTPAWPTPSPAAIVFPPPAVPRSPSVEPPARSPSSLSGTSRPSSVGPARPPSSEPPLPPAPLPWPLLAAGPAAVAASSRILYAGPSMASYLARQASAANPHLVAASQPSPPSTGPSRLAIGSPSRSSHHDRSSSGSRSSSSSVSSGSSRTSGTSRAPPSTSRGARRAPAASARPPHASPPGAARALGVDDGREGLLDGVKHVPEFFQSVLRQHIMTQAVRSSMQKAEMIASYQPWVVLTYGDSAKTKTVTLNKYARIVRTLHGEEPHSAENSKFRFWVRSKGFRIGLPPDAAPTPPRPAEHIAGSYAADTRTGQLYLREDAVETMPVLYVPTGTSSSAREGGRNVWKRVATVENFFDVIYTVHVDIEGHGSNKHAGQKKTYRTITDSYSFLPREAVTRFLLGCTECNKRPRSPSSPSRQGDDSGPSQLSDGRGDSSPSPPTSPDASASRSMSPVASAASAGTSAALANPLRYAEPSPLRPSTAVVGGMPSSRTFLGDLGEPASTAASPAASDHHLRFTFPPFPSAPGPPSLLSRPSGSTSILSGRSGPSAFHSPEAAPSLTADSDMRTSPAPAEAHLPALRPPPPPRADREQSGKPARASFSIESISKSSRSSPVPPETTAGPAKDLDDPFVVPRAPSLRPSAAQQPLQPLMPYKLPPPRLSYAESPMLQPLEAIAARTPGGVGGSPVDALCMPLPVRPLLPPLAAPPMPLPSMPPSSMLAGYEPAAGHGLLNLLLKTSGMLHSAAAPTPRHLDLSVPVTTSYLKHMRSLGYNDEDAMQIDAEMSLYQHVLGVPLKVVDDYL